MNEALNNLLTRRACRKYSEEQISAEKLDAILEAGIYGIAKGKKEAAPTKEGYIIRV